MTVIPAHDETPPRRWAPIQVAVVKRYAEVSGLFGAGRDPAEVVAAYLPVNYGVSGPTTEGVDGKPVVLIEGEDVAGWTLDDYVIPRLLSGLMGCREMYLHMEDDGYPENGPHVSFWLSPEPQK